MFRIVLFGQIALKNIIYDIQFYYVYWPCHCQRTPNEIRIAAFIMSLCHMSAVQKLRTAVTHCFANVVEFSKVIVIAVNRLFQPIVPRDAAEIVKRGRVKDPCLNYLAKFEELKRLSLKTCRCWFGIKQRAPNVQIKFKGSNLQQFSRSHTSKLINEKMTVGEGAEI